jgi:hypothetical protein
MSEESQAAQDCAAAVEAIESDPDYLQAALAT